jgi:hypothetical protein
MNQEADAEPDDSTYFLRTLFGASFAESELLIFLVRIIVESVLLVIVSRMFHALFTGIRSSISIFHRSSKV